jgi:hypothetical protein
MGNLSLWQMRIPTSMDSEEILEGYHAFSDQQVSILAGPSMTFRDFVVTSR